MERMIQILEEKLDKRMRFDGITSALKFNIHSLQQEMKNAKTPEEKQKLQKRLDETHVVMNILNTT